MSGGLPDRYRAPVCPFCQADDHRLCDPITGRGCECWCDLLPPPIPEPRTPP